MSTPSGSFRGGSGSDVAREIEEADIVKLQDGYFYVANPYTGLRIVDAKTIDQPQLKGRVPLGGRAVELFVLGDQAFVLSTADFLNCAGQTIGFEEGIFDPQVLPDFSGSRLWVVDVSDKDNPEVMTTLDFDGFVTATRRVGDVIYAAGNGVFGGGESDQNATDSSEPTTTIRRSAAFVTSINIADPQNVFIVETEPFAGRSLDVNVSGDVMYVFGNDSAIFDTSIVTYVDISDPAGTIKVRDQFRVPGSVDDRFSVDPHNGALRIVTEEFIRAVSATVVAMYIYDVSNPDEITRLARLPIDTRRSVRTVRMDGDRGYVVASRGDAPLLVLDLADPSNPRIVASLSLPGVSTQLHPLGDRLLGVGFDTSAGIRPTLVLYDVSDPADPRQTSRVVLGEKLTIDSRSTATVDEKALRVIEAAGLILLPLSTFDRDTGLFNDSVQFIELLESELREHGTIDHVGLVKRADVLDRRAWLLSDQSFQSVNIDDLDQPKPLALLEFISDQDLLDAGLSGCANVARERGTRIDFIPPMACGAFGPFLFILAFAGLSLLGFGVRRR